MLVRLCAFDYDDTLVQTRVSKYRAIKALAMRDYGVPLSDEEIDRVWGTPYSSFFSALFSRYDPDIDRVIRRYEALDAEFPISPYPDAVEAVSRMAVERLVGIVSACGRVPLVAQLRGAGFPISRMAFVLGAEDSVYHKPDPRVFGPVMSVMTSSGITGAEVVYIGDSDRDRLAAMSAGFQFIGVDRDVTQTTLMRSNGAEVVDSLLAVCEAVTRRLL
ncbi:MAG: HAD hydrolase-like protein [Gemmataceae bacterium]